MHLKEVYLLSKKWAAPQNYRLIWGYIWIKKANYLCIK